MASWDNNLGLWKASTGGYFSSKDDAVAAEAASQSPETAGAGNTYDTTDFQNNQGQAKAQKPIDPNDTPNPSNPGGMSNNDLWNSVDYQHRAATATANSNAGAGGGLGTVDIGQAPVRTTGILGGDGFTDSHGRRYQVQAQTPEDAAAYNAKLGTVTSQGSVGGAQSLGFEPPATSPPGGAASARDAAATEATQRAGNAFDAEHSQNQAIDSSAWSNAYDQFSKIGKTDYSLSDEARQYQQEGLAQQRQLLEKALGFNSNQYATQFADQGLARTIAAGRSTPGGYAAQQQGMLAAEDQAPSLYAEGARQAASLENQRLGTAATVAKNFGDLGTLTRGQDVNQAQFESNLALNIASGVADLTKGQVQLNQQDSQQFAEMWTDFAKLQSVYAGMTSQEQMAWWQTEAQKRGQDKQLQGVLDTIKANGAVSDKDLLNGLFQLGSGALKIAGVGGAA